MVRTTNLRIDFRVVGDSAWMLSRRSRYGCVFGVVVVKR